MANIIAFIIAYLIGSLSSSILISKYLKLPDPRTSGSGNAGATNILRTAGKNKALIVLIADALKGVLAILIARILGVEGFMLGLVALIVVLGHVFPLFFKFKGGKGVATAVGATLMLSPVTGILMALIWFAVAYFLRYSSLASLVSVICAPILIIIFSSAQYFLPLVLIAALVIWRHWDNIERLRKGTESKIDLKAKMAAVSESSRPSDPTPPPSHSHSSHSDNNNKDKDKIDKTDDKTD